jgi:hypothetical protein
VKRVILSLLVAVGACGGGALYTPRDPNLVVYPPPALPITPARETIVPLSQFMKVAVLDFSDQSSRLESLRASLADMLSTELYKSGRFEVYDRGQLRHEDFTKIIEACQKSQQACEEAEKATLALRDADFKAIQSATDAFLLSAITNVSPGRLTIDYRLVNAQSFAVMTAGSAQIGFQEDASTVETDRQALVQVAATLRGSLPTPTAGKLGKVLVQDGRVLTISLGRKDGIIPGMNVFVVGPGRVQMGADNKPNVIDEAYLAQAYVVSVYDNTSQVVVYLGDDFRVGDDVRFK